MDLKLKIGSIPLRIHGWFVLTALILGSNEREPVRLGLWVVVVTVSVVIHELGHALVGRAFGLSPRVELHGMGGTTFFDAPSREEGAPPPAPLGTGKSVAVSLAGPFAGFLFAALVIVTQMFGLRPQHPLVLHVVALLFTVNIGWGVFNLLPMLPLDGGNVLRALCRAISPTRGDRVARYTSIVIAAGIALYAVRREQWWVLYLGLLFAWQNVQAIRQADQARIDEALALAIDGANQAATTGDPKRALMLLDGALAESSKASKELRQIGVRLQVGVMLREQMWPEALVAIEREHASAAPEDLTRWGDALRASGHVDEAARVEALASGPAPLAPFRT
jgi:Zn-dependent protease